MHCTKRHCIIGCDIANGFRTNTTPTSRLLGLSQAREAADRERQRLFRDYELLQKAYKELKRDKESSALNDQVCYWNMDHLIVSCHTTLGEYHDIPNVLWKFIYAA